MQRKKVLLLTTPLNGYEKELIKAIELKGMKVTFFPEGSKINRKDLGIKWRIMRSFIKDFKISFFIKKFSKKEEELYSNYIKKLEENYDFIFDFGAKGRKTCLLKLKQNYPKAKLILYLWDDLKYSKNAWEIKELFDQKYIFNEEEAEIYKFKYLPNFYMNIFLYNGEKKDIDIYYKGSIRDKKRMEILKKIDEALPNLKKDISLYNKKGYWHNFRYTTSKKDFEKYSTNLFVTMKELACNYKKSKILLDIAYKNQSGLGLRPLEAIAADCKLITTNENIKKYEFYNENNIFVLKKDLSNINYLKNFITKDYEKLSDDLKLKYSVDGFVESIFMVSNDL